MKEDNFVGVSDGRVGTYHELELDSPGDPVWIRKNRSMLLLVIENSNLSS